MLLYWLKLVLVFHIKFSMCLVDGSVVKPLPGKRENPSSNPRHIQSWVWQSIYNPSASMPRRGKRDRQGDLSPEAFGAARLRYLVAGKLFLTRSKVNTSIQGCLLTPRYMLCCMWDPPPQHDPIRTTERQTDRNRWKDRGKGRETFKNIQYESYVCEPDSCIWFLKWEHFVKWGTFICFAIRFPQAISSKICK